MQVLDGYADNFKAVAFSPNGQTVASASEYETIRLWDATTGVQRRNLQGYTDRAIAVILSPDGQKMAPVQYEAIGVLIGLFCSLKGPWAWNAIRLQLQSQDRRTDGVTAVAFSPEGQTVASTSRHAIIRLWDAATSVEQEIYRADLIVDTLAFSANGCYLETNYGSFPLKRQSPSSFTEQPRAKILIKKKWIMRDGQRLVWLPPDFRASCVAVSNNRVVLGHRSGFLTFLWLHSGH